MDWNKLFSILGLCLGLFGTIFSLWAALAIKIEDIKKEQHGLIWRAVHLKIQLRQNFKVKLG